MYRPIDSTSFHTKFLSGELQHQRNYGIVSIEFDGQANGWKVSIIDDAYEIAGGTELVVGGEALCSAPRIALKPDREGRKVITYTPEIPAGTGPTVFSAEDAIEEVNANIREDHPDFPLADHVETQLEQLKALKDGEQVRWEIAGDEYFIDCKEMTVEEIDAMPEFDGY